MFDSQKVVFDSQKAGKQIAFLRKRKGITQEELAARLAVSPQAVSKWENGRAMPEISLLAELTEILGTTADGILFPAANIAQRANFEHILLPYEKIAEFSGSKWPRSMAFPAVLAAVKLLMGLEERKDFLGRQINDDVDYILQSAFTGICFGYSWGKGMCGKNCLGIYGLQSEVVSSDECDPEMLQSLAVENILKGYPVVVEPAEYEDMILAVGFSQNGEVLKGLAFLDGDDDKNARISFDELQDFSGWSQKKCNLILIGPVEERVALSDACMEALREGFSLLTNEIHRFEEPLTGYGLVIYDNWCRELQKETAGKLDTVECLYPQVFIHYENKMRVKAFLEYCIHTLNEIDGDMLAKAVSKYGEMLDIFEKAMHEWLNDQPQSAEAAADIRRGFEWVLKRCKELEKEALCCWEMAIKC